MISSTAVNTFLLKTSFLFVCFFFALLGRISLAIYIHQRQQRRINFLQVFFEYEELPAANEFGHEVEKLQSLMLQILNHDKDVVGN